MQPVCRSIESKDFAAILEINHASLTGVSQLAPDYFAQLTDLCEHSKLCEIADNIVGYLFAMREDLEYDGEEYHWFCDHVSDEFLYIDQVAIGAPWRRQGYASLMYRDLHEFALRERVKSLVCEVDIEPANHVSLTFHQGLGFREVARMPARNIIVALMRKNIEP
jgi:predicted GNAT superfamily acetyltransferase